MDILQQKYGLESRVASAGHQLKIGFADCAELSAYDVEELILDLPDTCMDVVSAWVLSNAHLVRGVMYGSLPRDIAFEKSVFFRSMMQKVGMAHQAVLPGPNTKYSVDAVLNTPAHESADLGNRTLMVLHDRDAVDGIVSLSATEDEKYAWLRNTLLETVSQWWDLDIQDVAEVPGLYLQQSRLNGAPSSRGFCSRLLNNVKDSSECAYFDLMNALNQAGFAYEHKWKRADVVVSNNTEARVGHFKPPSGEGYPFTSRLISHRPTQGQPSPHISPTGSRFVCLPE